MGVDVKGGGWLGDGRHRLTCLPRIGHNDNNSSDSVRRRPLCAAQADTRKGSDRFEKLANSVCWKASLGLGYLWNHV